jgi:hypothetical protein
MAEALHEKLRRWRAGVDRRTWREALRADFAPWFDNLDFGFQCDDGWAYIVGALTTEIAEIVGGPEKEPRIRISQVKEKYGTLRYYVIGLPATHCDAIDRAIQRAEERSGRICEACGGDGKLRQGRFGYIYAACDRHAVR